VRVTRGGPSTPGIACSTGITNSWSPGTRGRCSACARTPRIPRSGSTSARRRRPTRLRDDAPPIGLLRRFDGAAWTEELLPPGVAVQRLSVAPTGDLYALVAPVGASDQTPDELWHRPARGAEWKRIPLPEVRFPAEPDGSAAERTTTLSPTELLARGPDDVWIVARTDLDTRVGQVTTIREVVLRSQPAGVPLRMANDVELDREVRKPDGPR